MTNKDGTFSGSVFEVCKPAINFQTEYAVYRKGHDNSICYVTDLQRGELITRALDHFQECGKFDEWLDYKRREKQDDT